MVRVERKLPCFCNANAKQVLPLKSDISTKGRVKPIMLCMVSHFHSLWLRKCKETFIKEKIHFYFVLFLVTGCGNTYTNLRSGMIAAPIYNKDLMPPGEVMQCSWKIDAELKYKVALSFDDDTDFGNHSYLEVRDGFNEKAPLLANFSGMFTIHFRSHIEWIYGCMPKTQGGVIQGVKYQNKTKRKYIT